MIVRALPEIDQLDERQVRRALRKHDGNISKCADALRVRSERLRAFVDASPACQAEMAEISERGVDEAVAVVFTALRDEGSFLNRFYAAKEILRSEAGRRRGYGPRESATSLYIEGRKEPAGGVITLRWLDEAPVLSRALVEGLAKDEACPESSIPQPVEGTGR
jgi:hypothetical protein